MNKLFQIKFGFIALLGAASMSVSQQATAAGPIAWGIKAGLGYGNMSATDTTGTAVDSAYKLGFLAGGGMEIGVGPVGVGIDALYAMRSIDAAGVATTKMNRLEIPVIARFSTGMVAFSAGGYWAMNIGTPQVTVGTAAAVDATNVASSDFGLIAGVGIGIPALLAGFTLDLRYNFGLAELTDVPTGSESSKFRSFDLVAGVTF